MRRRSSEFQPIPDETASVAGVLYAGGNGFLTIGDRYHFLFDGLHFERIARDQAVLEPSSSLAMITIFQFTEGLTDAEAIAALRTRVDWDYALHLPLDHAGFDPKALAEFRRGLLADSRARQDFALLLKRVRSVMTRWPWPAEALQAEGVIASVELTNALHVAIKALWLAVEALAMEAPGWLWQRPWLQSRYAHSHGWLHLPADPCERGRLARTVQQDGLRLVTEASAADAPIEVSSLAELKIVWHVWRWQFSALALPESGGDQVDAKAAHRAAG
jgi:transposase